MERIRLGFINRIIKTSSCWLWTGVIMNTGYGHYYYDGKYHLAHRVSYELFIGGIPKDSYVLHRCDNRMCVNPTHLYAGDHQDNMNDMVRNGHSQKGERHYGNKVSEDDVIAIRGMTDKKLMSTRELGRMYGIHPTTVSHIIHRRTWAHVQ